MRWQVLQPHAFASSAIKLSVVAWLYAYSIHAAPQRPTLKLRPAFLSLLPLSSSSTTTASLVYLRGGESDASAGSYALQLEMVKANILQSAMAEIEELRRQVVELGEIIPNFGQAAENLCNQALEEFAASAPDASATAVKTGDNDDGDDMSNDWDVTSAEAAAAYDAKVTELELALDAPLQLLFYKQLSYMREQALQRFRTAVQTDRGISEFEAMSQADAQFVRMATEATREGALDNNGSGGSSNIKGGNEGDWDYSRERAFLQSIMNQMASTTRQAAKVKQEAVFQHQSVMQFLQQQQQMIQQLQMQLYGQSSPWNVGLAYRIPDTNFNLQGTYQQGRANVQLSCVPDEYAQFLGPNGFTNGVGPGNLGVSVNLSI